MSIFWWVEIHDLRKGWLEKNAIRTASLEWRARGRHAHSLRQCVPFLIFVHFPSPQREHFLLSNLKSFSFYLSLLSNLLEMCRTTLNNDRNEFLSFLFLNPSIPILSVWFGGEALENRLKKPVAIFLSYKEGLSAVGRNRTSGTTEGTSNRRQKSANVECQPRSPRL